MKQAVLSLGSNLGDREKNIRDAVSALSRLPMTNVLCCTSIIETKAVEVSDDQPDYLNCCLLLETDFSPEVLLGCCIGTESAMGRERPYNKAPRVIDIDLILYAGETRNTHELILPHPRWKEREFVVKPMRELNKGRVSLDPSLFPSTFLQEKDTVHFIQQCSKTLL